MPSLQDLNMLGSFAGGIGLFLLGMKLMTDGLKLAAGGSYLLESSGQDDGTLYIRIHTFRDELRAS